MWMPGRKLADEVPWLVELPTHRSGDVVETNENRFRNHACLRENSSVAETRMDARITDMMSVGK
jgi:hypothetical protein